MAWNIAIVVDPQFGEEAIGQLARYHPLWIIDTPSNRLGAAIARRAAGEIWAPEAACTTYQVDDIAAREHNCLSILETIELHHPNLAKLSIVGIENTASLALGMKEFGFTPARATEEDFVAFRRPVTTLATVPIFQFDASDWRCPDDVYTALFERLGAPEWHGRNFNALNDSIVTGGINAVEVPYKISVCAMRATSPEVRDFVLKLATFISDREAEGCPVSIQIEN
jgi:hypothetical protein